MIAFLPFALILILLLAIFAIIAALFGSDVSFYQSYFVLPFDSTTYTITSPYGERIDPIDGSTAFHYGIDVVPTSANIVAVADGTVITSDLQEINGEHIVVEHKVAGQVYRSGYYHLKENSRTVKVGDTVKQGQQLGIMGSTGKSTGAHLHFTLQKFNAMNQKFEYTDPSIVINNKISAKEFDLFDYSSKDDKDKFDNLYQSPLIPTNPTVPSLGQ